MYYKSPQRPDTSCIIISPSTLQEFYVSSHFIDKETEMQRSAGTTQGHITSK